MMRGFSVNISVVDRPEWRSIWVHAWTRRVGDPAQSKEHTAHGTQHRWRLYSAGRPHASITMAVDGE